jgi:AcrR family transcriptional regulator
MPYPAKVNRDRILDAARDIIEREGVELLSLAKLAAALGVSAPSLYKHFENKNDLLREVNLQSNAALVESMLAALNTISAPQEQIMGMAHAFRNFAHRYPTTYALMYSSNPDLRPDSSILEALAIPLQKVFAELCGEVRSLAALRGAYALLHGFVSLELNNQFQRGGSLDDAFTESVQTYIRGLES